MKPRDRIELRVRGKRLVLPADPSLMTVTYDDALTSVERRTVERSLLGTSPRRRYEVPGQRLTVVGIATPQDGSGSAGGLPSVVALNAQREVEHSQLLFRYGEYRVALTSRVLIKMVDAAIDARARLSVFGLVVVEQRGDRLVCETLGDADPVEAAESVSRQAWVVFAEVDLVTMGVHPPEGSDVSVLGPAQATGALQPALSRIGAGEAWARSVDGPEIRIAVLDDGCHEEHAALRGRVAGRYDAMADSSLLTTHPWDSHGTACAALAAGRDDAAAFRGLADGCTLLAVRIASRPSPGQAWATSSLAISRGILWAVSQQADVLSNSWGGGVPSSAIIDALEQARLMGRQRLGCVIVQAVGNNAGPVLFPATLDGVLAVSGTNLEDEFKTPTSSDGESWWGSCLGPEVDIAAPSVGLRTADSPGAPGESPDDYYARFNGTSAATPLVAAAAAAVLRARPSLTEAQVRSLLCETAAKIGPLAQGRLRDDGLGYGRLDLAKALERILGPATAPIPVPTPAPAPGAAPGPDPAPTPDPMPAATHAGLATGLLNRITLVQALHTLTASSGETAVVHAFMPGDALTVAQMQRADDAAFATGLGVRRTLRYRDRTSTAQGSLFWGATLVKDADGETIPPGEVRLPRPEDDVFMR